MVTYLLSSPRCLLVVSSSFCRLLSANSLSANSLSSPVVSYLQTPCRLLVSYLQTAKFLYYLLFYSLTLYWIQRFVIGSYSIAQDSNLYLLREVEDTPLRTQPLTKYNYAVCIHQYVPNGVRTHDLLRVKQT